MSTIAERLNYEMSERTRLKVRIEVYEEFSDEPRIDWIRTCQSFEEAQERYIEARDASGLGASGFGDGEVFDEMGQTLARISYNGRLWAPLPWTPEARPVAEAPSSKAPAAPEDDSPTP